MTVHKDVERKLWDEEIDWEDVSGSLFRFGFPESGKFGGTSEYALSSDDVQWLITQDLLTPDALLKGSGPTVREVLEFLEENPDMGAVGYMRQPLFKGHPPEIQLEGVVGEPDDNGYLHTLFSEADEFEKLPSGEWWVWYD